MVNSSRRQEGKENAKLTAEQVRKLTCLDKMLLKLKRYKQIQNLERKSK